MICIYVIYVYVYMSMFICLCIYMKNIFNQNLIDIFLLFVVNAEVDTNFCFKLLFYKLIFIFFWLKIESSQQKYYPS